MALWMARLWTRQDEEAWQRALSTLSAASEGPIEAELLFRDVVFGCGGYLLSRILYRLGLGPTVPNSLAEHINTACDRRELAAWLGAPLEEPDDAIERADY